MISESSKLYGKDKLVPILSLSRIDYTVNKTTGSENERDILSRQVFQVSLAPLRSDRTLNKFIVMCYSQRVAGTLCNIILYGCT